METENKNPIQVSERLFGTLEYLSERESAGLMEIARHLKLNKSTAHRILRSLICLGYDCLVSGLTGITPSALVIARLKCLYKMCRSLGDYHSFFGQYGIEFMISCTILDMHSSAL